MKTRSLLDPHPPFRREAAVVHRSQILAIGLLSALALAPIQARAAGPKLGVVDVKKVMDADPAWEKMVKTLKHTWTKKQAKLRADQDALRVSKEQLDAKSMLSDPTVIARERAELIRRAQELAEHFVKEQKAISQQELALKDQMLKRIEPVVYELASRKNYTYIFEKGAPSAPNVLYAAARVDLTQEVIRQYKKTYKNKPFEMPKAQP